MSANAAAAGLAASVVRKPRRLTAWSGEPQKFLRGHLRIPPR